MDGISNDDVMSKSRLKRLRIQREIKDALTLPDNITRKLPDSNTAEETPAQKHF